MKADKSIFRLYAVTDRFGLPYEEFIKKIGEALSGGITCLQLREKNIFDEDFLKEAIEVKKMCRKHNVPLIINDNVKIALECGADGVHIGHNDMSIKQARKILGDDFIIGVSAHNVGEALEAEKNGADYLGTGAAFGSKTKKDANAISHQTIADICKAVKIPVVAIGGIEKTNVLELKGTGIDGIAVISAVFRSESTVNECKELLSLLNEVL